MSDDIGTPDNQTKGGALVATHKVRVGTQYIFYANPLDYTHRDLNGLVGTVVNLPGCPPANTMGHCYFQVDGSARLVSTNSLYKLSERQIVIMAMNGDIAREKLQQGIR